CWRTSRSTNSVARFGLAANTLGWEARGQVLTNNHCVELTNLAPDTKYYYSVGATDTNLANGEEFYFITAPTHAKPTRIWALGDCGTASQPFQTGALQVRDAYLAYTGSRETDVWLMLGDNAYSYGTDSEYQAAVFDVYQADLDDNTNEWIVAFWHSPPYTKGSHNSDVFTDSEGRLFWMREQVCPLLERNGVDLVLCGHSHCYERSYLMHGHYGTSLELMPSMIVDGSSGRPEESGPYQKPDMGPHA